MAGIDNLINLIRERAFYESGGGEANNAEKLNQIFGTISTGANNYSDQRRKAIAEQIGLENQQMKREEDLRKKKKISEVFGTPIVKGQIEEAEQAPIPLEDLISGKLNTRQAGIDAASQTAKDVQDQYGNATLGDLPEMDILSKIRERALESKTKKMPDYKSTADLRKEFIDRPEVKEFVTVSTQVKSMDSLLSNALKGNKRNQLALDQALITMYNKLTDPSSVVRESEYARTPENLPVINRISGAIEKLQQGGAGITDEDRKALVLGAKIIANERGKVFQERKQAYSDLATKIGGDPSLVTATLPSFSEYPIDESAKYYSPIEIKIAVSKGELSPEKGKQILKSKFGFTE